jgi:hypothetical protein
LLHLVLESAFIKNYFDGFFDNVTLEIFRVCRFAGRTSAFQLRMTLNVWRAAKPSVDQKRAVSTIALYAA